MTDILKYRLTLELFLMVIILLNNSFYVAFISLNLLWRKVMPKIYEYFGLVILFYSNEHEPVHVHCKYQEKESRELN